MSLPLPKLLSGSKKLACVILLTGIAGALVDVTAQRITILDFSTTVFKPRKHVPKPFPPGKMLGGRCGGVTSGKLIVSLVSLDRTEYDVGDEFHYTLEVRTAGTETVKVPTVLNIADLEPDDPNTSFRYAATEIWLGMSDESKRYTHVPLLRLYGSDDMPWTEIELKPGTSIEIRGKARIRPLAAQVELFDAPYMGSTEDLPMGEVSVLTTSWRGDSFYYEGSTHYEYPGNSACPEEIYTVVYGNKISLRSSSDH